MSHVPLPGSPLIDEANGIGSSLTDQRGFDRVVGPGMDLGSVEFRETDTDIIWTINRSTDLSDFSTSVYGPTLDPPGIPFIDPSPPAEGKAFYRIEVNPAP